MKAYVAVTDNEWFRFLSQRPELDEVNFWQPSAHREFRTLTPGQPFLFKLHYPENYVVGGGFFVHYSPYPLSLAWQAFQEKNGAASFEEMRKRLEKYRRRAGKDRGAPLDPHEDYKIGCILLQDPFFFRESDWISAPRDFHPNIVQGKSYDLRSGIGRELWEAVQFRMKRLPRERARDTEAPIYGEPVLVKQRLGQGTFRVLITDIYQRRCAVTGEKALPALDAAHIRPLSEEGRNRIDNGLLLRSDIHRVFDAGYVTVAPDYRFLASRRLKDDFHNGEEYLKLSGTKLWLPGRTEDRPNREFLEWHAGVVFRS